MKTFAFSCPECGHVTTVEITDEEFENHFVQYKHIQQAMPNREPKFRELFVTGLCYNCQDKIFHSEE